MKGGFVRTVGVAVAGVAMVAAMCLTGSAAFGADGVKPAAAQAAPPSEPKRGNEPAKLDAPTGATPLKPAPKPADGVKPASNSAPADAGNSPVKTSEPASAPAKPEMSEPAKLDAPAKPEPAAKPTPDPGKAHTLRYRWETNQVVRFDVTHEMTITSQKDQTIETAKNESKTRKHYRVVTVNADGSALLELVIDRVRMSARFGENDPLVFDSESTDAPPRQFVGVKESIGKPTAKVKFSPTGELLDVIRGTAPAAPGGARQETPDNDPSNNFLAVLPKEPVKIGQTWSDKYDVRVQVQPGLTRPVTILRKYELASVENDLATIRVLTSVLTPINDPQINGQLIQRTPTGTIVFDLANGRIVSRETKLDKTEVGVFGGNSSMRAVGTQVEKLVARDEKPAAEPVRTAADPEKKNPQ